MTDFAPVDEFDAAREHIDRWYGPASTFHRVVIPAADINFTPNPDPWPDDDDEGVTFNIAAALNGRHSVSFEFTREIDADGSLFDALFGGFAVPLVRKRATVPERAVALAVLAEQVVALPLLLTKRLVLGEARALLSIPYILRGVVR